MLTDDGHAPVDAISCDNSLWMAFHANSFRDNGVNRFGRRYPTSSGRPRLNVGFEHLRRTCRLRLRTSLCVSSERYTEFQHWPGFDGNVNVGRYGDITSRMLAHPLTLGDGYGGTDPMTGEVMRSMKTARFTTPMDGNLEGLTMLIAIESGMIRILCPPGQVLTGIAGILGSSKNTTGVMPRCGVPAGFSVKDYTEHDIPESSDIDPSRVRR